MKMAGQYKATTINKIPSGHAFSSSTYSRNGVTPYIALRATRKTMQGIIIFNGAVFEQNDDAVSEDMISPLFYDLQSLGDTGEYDVLDITENIDIEPDLKSVTNYQALNSSIPNGALVFLDETVLITTLVAQGRPRSSHLFYVNIRNGEETHLKPEEKFRSAICLKWALLAHRGTPNQQLLYEYHYCPDKSPHNAAT